MWQTLGVWGNSEKCHAMVVDGRVRWTPKEGGLYYIAKMMRALDRLSGKSITAQAPRAMSGKSREGTPGDV